MGMKGPLLVWLSKEDIDVFWAQAQDHCKVNPGLTPEYILSKLIQEHIQSDIEAEHQNNELLIHVFTLLISNIDPDKKQYKSQIDEFYELAKYACRLINGPQ